jgi:hypothetical protein
VPDIFDEVEEEVRAEQWQRFLARYAWAIVAGVILVIAAVAGWRVWEWRQSRLDAMAASQYLTAISQAQTPGEAGKPAREAATGLLIGMAQNAPAGYRTLARLRAAGLLADEGKLAEALNLYNAVATDSSADPLLRELATLLWAERQIDSGDPQVLAARLKPLADGDSPWRPLAQCELALLDLREHQTDAARATLQRLSADAAAPAGVRDSAALLLQQLGG